MKKYLETGIITRIHGVKGEVKIQPWADSAELLTVLPSLYLHEGKDRIDIEYMRVHKNSLILKIRDICTPEQAQKLRNEIIFLNRDDLPLEDGAYFIQDLIGLSVYDADKPDHYYGEITNITQTGANDVYHIQDGGKLRLIPAISDVVIDVDIEKEIIRIRPLAELFDDED